MLVGQQPIGVRNEAICGRCRGALVFDADTGENICSSCGVVANVQSTYESEIGSNSREPRSSMFYDFDLSTVIDGNNVDANQNRIYASDGINRLRMLNKSAIDNPKRRNLLKASREILRLTELLGLGNVIAERAWYTYRKAQNKGLVRGRSISGLVAATIYITCKEMEIPCSMDELADLAKNPNKKIIASYCKFLLKNMGLTVSLPSSSSYVPKIARRAGLSPRTERRALEILSQIENNILLSGKRPDSLAASALYLASLQMGEPITQLRIAIASNLTTVTVRKRCAEMASLWEHIQTSRPIPPEETKIAINTIAAEQRD